MSGMNGIDDSTMANVESILYAPWPIPVWLTIVIAAALLVSAVWIYLAERGSAGRGVRFTLAGLRFTILCLVLWMLAGWSWQRFRSDRPELIVVVDTSASMATRDVAVPNATATRSRFEFARNLFDVLDARQRVELQQRYQWKWFAIADKGQPLEVDWRADSASVLGQIQPDGAESRLGDSLNRLIDRQAGRGTAALLLVSDGIATSGATLSDVALRARRAAIPVHTVVVGQEFVQPDLRLVDLLVDREVYFGDQVAAEVSVVASDIAATSTRVALIDDATDQVLDSTTIELSSERNQQPIRLAFVPSRAGEISLRVVVDSVAGETDKANNVLRATVNVQDKAIRVLMVFETPSYEFRFLKSLLERAQEGGETRTASFEVRSILQDADPTYVEQDATAQRLVPSSSDALKEFDVFVFGELNPSLISRGSQQAIVDAVTQKGAGSIFVFGEGNPAKLLQNWPLGKLLPVELVAGGQEVAVPQRGPWRWQPTSLGMAALPMQLAATPRETMAAWEQLPPVNTLAGVGRSKTGAQVLAEAVAVADGSSVPLLITQFAGAGRTALQATDETYSMTSFRGSDAYHQRYWGQMLRWLSRGKLLRDTEQSALVVDPKQARLGQPVRLQLALKVGAGAELQPPETAEVMIEGSDGGKRSVTLDRTSPNLTTYQAVLNDLAPGKYRAVLLRPIEATPPDVEFTVIAPPGEQANLRADRDAMRNLAEQTRGRHYAWESTAGLFSQLPLGKPTRLGSLPPLPMWNLPFVAAIFVVLLTAEWLLRRRARML